MKVLTYTSLFPNAAQPELGVFIFQRMNHFAARPGNEVHVIAPVPYLPAWLAGKKWKKYAAIPAFEQRGNLTVYHPRYLLLPKISMPIHGLLMFLGSFLLARRLHRAHKFEIIDSHYVFPDSLAAVLIGKWLGLPVVASARGTDINSFPEFRLIRPQIRWTLNHCAGAIAVCTALKDEMIAVAGPQRDVQVIGNGVDPTRFIPLNRAEARTHLGLPLEAQLAVAVGALIPRKGFHFLIPAFAEINDQFPKLQIYIVGEGDFRSELETLIQEYGVADRFHLRGACPNPQLRYWYSAADVSCLVSSREGWPNVLLESLACGTPVVATGVWGTPEVITSPELGVIVEQSVASIAAGLKTALKKKWDRQYLSAYARGRDWNVVAGEVEEYLQQVMQRFHKLSS